MAKKGRTNMLARTVVRGLNVIVMRLSYLLAIVSEKIQVLPNTLKILLCHKAVSYSVCYSILAMLLEYSCSFLLLQTFSVSNTVSRLRVCSEASLTIS